MKKTTLIAISALMASLSCQAFAEDGADRAKELLKETLPRLTVDSIEESIINGVYEVQAGANILYFHPGTKALILGEIYQNGKSLTAEKRESATAKKAGEKLAKFPFETAIKLGSGKNVVIEITDPDCPYCQKAFKEMVKHEDVTRYVVFAPLSHPQAITKGQYVIDAKDKDKAYGDMMSGKSIPAGYKPSPEAVAKSEAMLAVARDMGVTGTPTFFINGSMVVGADMAKIDKLLK